MAIAVSIAADDRTTSSATQSRVPPARRFWPSVLLFLFAISATAAPTNAVWYARVWKSDDGLPNNNVTALAQTPDGYLWMATPSRLARFDGDRFEEFSQNDFANGYNQKITLAVCGRDGSLWLPMDRGPVVHLKNGVTEMISNNVPVLVAEDAVEDGDGALWISYRGGTLRRIKDGKVFQFSASDGFPEDYGGCILAKDNTGCCWLVKKGEIFTYRNGRFQSRLQLPGAATRMAGARAGGLWICSGVDFFKYDEEHGLKEIGKINPEQPRAMPTALLEARDGTVWIGTSSGGLFHFDGSGFEAIPTSHHDILSLFEDRAGNIWVGTGGGGLNLIQPRGIELQGAESGLPFEAVQSLCEDSRGTLWAVTQNGQLVERTNNFWATLSIPTNWPGRLVDCVTADREGGVWIGGRGRLYYLRDGNFQSWAAADGLSNHIIRALLSDENGDLWIGGETLEKFHGGTFAPLKLPDGIQLIRTMARDAAGNLWAGSANGFLLRVTNSEALDESVRVFGGRDSIRCLTATPDGSLWIGFSTDGLGRLKDGKFFRFRVAQGLADESISQVLPDGLGWLWLGADHGIFKVREKELDAVADGKMERVQTIHYGRDEELPSLQANYGASPGAMRARDGDLWIPLRSALAAIHPARLGDNLNPPPVFLKRVAVDDRAVAVYGGVMPVGNLLDLQKTKSGLLLPPGHHRLEFEFTALNFATPENVEFRYRLAGVDDNWVDAKNQRSAGYAHLTTGHYQFQVSARKNGGAWNTAGTVFAFEIKPFFWETWWFRIAVVVLFTAGVIAIGRYVSFRRLRSRLRVLEQQAALEKERARIARDIHDDLGGSLTQTTLLLNLTLQDRHEPEKVSEHMHQVTTAIREVTESLDEIVWAANPRNDTVHDLVNYLSHYAVQFLQTAGVRCRIDSPPSLPARPLSPEVRHNLFLVAKEALNNTVRHARAREVRLHVLVTDKSLGLNVSDDGCGFNGEPRDNGADGLRNMQKRIEEIGGQFRVESKPGAGTRISVIYPWTPRD